MRAARLNSDRRLEILEVRAPVTEADRIVVKVDAAGVCGTDLHFLQGLLDPSGFPRILGHEMAVRVVDDHKSHSVGDRFAVYNVLFCGDCAYCRSGRQRLCTNSAGMLGFSVDGGFAEYVAVPERNLVPLPDEVGSDVGAVLACSGMTAVHAVRLSGIGLGDLVVVDGIGGVGLMLIQAATAAGSRVIAVGDRQDKLDLAIRAGAKEAVLIDNADAYADLNKALSKLNLTPEAFFETVGTSESMTAGFQSLAPGGSFVQIGYTKDRIDVHPSQLIKNELRLITSAAGSLADLETAIQLAASGAINASIVPRHGLDELPTALDALQSRAILGRSVIVLDDMDRKSS